MRHMVLCGMLLWAGILFGCEREAYMAPRPEVSYRPYAEFERVPYYRAPGYRSYGEREFGY